MVNPAPGLSADPRLILSEDELDRALELFLLAEVAVWTAADGVLDRPHPGTRLGRGHFRAAFLLKRRPGLGVQELARLTGLSKQGASRVLKELIEGGYAEALPGALDARRRPTHLTAGGLAFEAEVSSALRALLARAYREGGIDAAPGARRILAAIAGPKLTIRRADTR
jgi:DNA-binding MarR family transcriptional regulator